jgi:hypothetical protein
LLLFGLLVPFLALLTKVCFPLLIHIIAAFDEHLRKSLIVNVPILETTLCLSEGILVSSITIPVEHTLYDYFYDSKFLSWRQWSKMIEEDGISCTSQKAFTEDLIRISYLVRICFSQDSHVLIHSNHEGSGKSTCLKHAFDAFSTKKGVKRVFLSIHEKTPSTEFGTFMQKTLFQKRHKTVGLGPGDSLIAMVDDLCNESISANPALFGTWRSYVERSGWYSNGQFLTVEDLRVGITLCTSKRYTIPDIQKRALCHFINFPLADNHDEKLLEIGSIWMRESQQELVGPYFECFDEILVNITVGTRAFSN